MLKYEDDVTLSSKQLSGFIQLLSIRPFYISLFTYKQLDILQRITKYSSSTVLHPDSTGTVSAHLPKEFRNKSQFYYAMVVRLIGSSDTSVLPVLEFVSNSHSVITIKTDLHHFFST